MKKRLVGIAKAALAGALVFAVGCEKEPTREEIMRKQWGDVMTKSKFEKMKAEAEEKRKAQEEAFSKSIGGAMVKRTLEAASGGLAPLPLLLKTLLDERHDLGVVLARHVDFLGNVPRDDRDFAFRDAFT